MGSSKNITPNRETIRSKLSSNRCTCASATRNRVVSVSFAAAIIGSEMSTPTPSAPVLAAIALITLPVPQPDVEHPPRPFRPGGLDEQVLERLEHLVEDIREADPALSSSAVPHRGLFAVHLWCHAPTVLLQVDLRSSVVAEMGIGEVVRRSGVPASTLRYYEERGLIGSIGRRGLTRVFDETVFERLALITVGRAAGFSLDEIALMFASDGRPRLDRSVLAGKADELDATITRLVVMRDGLRHAAACPAPSHVECPTFRRILREAGSTG